MATRAWMLSILLAPSVAFGGVDGEAARSAQAVAEGTVCEMRKPTGSRIAVKVCTTAAEREHAREKAHRDLLDWGRCAGNEHPCIEVL